MSSSERGPLPAVALLALCFAGCESAAVRSALTLAPESLARRQLQTRRYDTRDEKMIVTAAAGLLQDLGFTIEKSELGLGLIVASKERSAVETGQVIGSIVILLLTGASSPIDDTQTMRACVVTRPFGETGKSVLVRVTFQRIVYDTRGMVSKAEGLFDEEFYAEFFQKLSKAVFLEGQKL